MRFMETHTRQIERERDRHTYTYTMRMESGVVDLVNIVSELGEMS